jgi:hypothetical protein
MLRLRKWTRLRARIEALEKEQAETLQEKTLFEQKPLEQAPTVSQMEVVPNQSTENEESSKTLRSDSTTSVTRNTGCKSSATTYRIC